MSHFNLHIFTPEPLTSPGEIEQILERWDENREVEPYFDHLIPLEEAQRLRDKHGPEKTVEEFIKYWEDHNAHWSEEKQGYEVFTDRTPEAKWDWWSIGGRWDKSLITKTGHGVNSAQLQDLGFAARIDMLKAEANARYDHFETLTAGLDIPPTFSEFMEIPGVTRADYESVPWVVAANKANPDSWVWPHYEWHIGTGGREAYVAEHSSPDVPRAWIGLDGEWHERGETGWFGAVFNEVPYHEHVAAYRAYRDSLPGSTCVILIDCHI